MLNARLCQKTLFRRTGYEMRLQSPFGIGNAAPSPLELPTGQITSPAGNAAIAASMLGVLRMVTKPAGCFVEVFTGLSQLGSCGSDGSGCGVHPGGGTAA